MKKILSITLLALMVFALPVALVGCGKKSESAPKTLTKEYLVGTWTFYDLIVENGAEKPSDVKEHTKEEYFTFSSNGSASFFDGKDTFNYTYTIADNIVTLHSNDPDHEIEYKDGYLLTPYKTNIYIAYKKSK